MVIRVAGWAGRAGRLPVKEKLSPSFFNQWLMLGGKSVILLLCVVVAHIKKDSRLSPFGVVPNQVRVTP